MELRTRPPVVVPTGLIQSLQRGLRVLDYVAAAGSPVVAKQVAFALDLNLSTAYHLLTTLEYEGYVRRTTGRAFEPSSTLGRRSIGGQPDSQTVAMQRLLGRAAFAVDDVAVLSRRDGDLVRVVASSEVPAADCAGFAVPGRIQCIATSAPGLALLAALEPRACADAISSAASWAAQRQEPFCCTAVVEQVQRTARDGVAVVVEEGRATIAAALTSHAARSAAASVVVTASRLRRERERLALTVRQTAAAIAKAMAAETALQPT